MCYDVTHYGTYFRCPNSVLKFHVDRFCSFRDSCNIICRPFWLYIIDHGNFGVAHALYHVTLSQGVQNNSYEIFDPYLPIHYATFIRLWWWFRSISIVKRCLGKKFWSPVKNGPHNLANSGKWGSKYYILCSWPRKGTSLRRTAFWHTFHQNRSRGLGCSELQEQKSRKN